MSLLRWNAVQLFDDKIDRVSVFTIPDQGLSRLKHAPVKSGPGQDLPRIEQASVTGV